MIPLTPFRTTLFAILCGLLDVFPAWGQTGAVAGTVRDHAGTPLPGVTVEVTSDPAAPQAITDVAGVFRIERLPSGSVTLAFRHFNFGDQTRPDVAVRDGETATLDVTMLLALTADVTVTGKRTFVNLLAPATPARHEG